MKKTISLFLVMATMVSMLYTCSWASYSPTVEMTEYDYKISGGLNSYGGIYVPFFTVGNKTYVTIDSNDYLEKQALMDVETGNIVLDNSENGFQNISEYSDLICTTIDNKNIIYDIEKNDIVCELANLDGLGYSGHFSEEGGFVTLESDQKLHFISNEGVIGNAVNIDHSQYSDGDYHLMTWNYLGEGLYKLVKGSIRGAGKTIGIVNSKGEIVTYVDSAEKFINGLAIVKKNDKYGLIDKYGNIIIPYEYTNIEYYRETELYYTEKDNMCYTIDAKGNMIHSFTLDFELYDSVYEYIGADWAVVEKETDNFRQRCGVVNSSNEIIIPLEYKSIYVDNVSDGLYCFRCNNGVFNYICGYIDKNGNIAIPFEYDYAHSFSEGLAAVEKNGKYGFIDKSGNTVISFEYDYADTFSEGLAAAEKDGKYGYIDKNGNTVIPFEYDYAHSFSEGLAAVQKDGKYGYIDKSDNTVIPFEYDYANSFSDGVAKVWLSDNYSVTINMNNEIISAIDVYSLTNDYDWPNRIYPDGIIINETGKTVDISHLNVLPCIIGKNGQHIIAFSQDFEKAYRIVINDESTTVAPKTEITDFTVENQDANTVANLSIANSNDSTIIYVASYNSNGKMLDLHTPAVSNGTAVATFKTTDIAELKAFIWDNKLNPIAESKSINLSK